MTAATEDSNPKGVRETTPDQTRIWNLSLFAEFVLSAVQHAMSAAWAMLHALVEGSTLERQILRHTIHTRTVGKVCKAQNLLSILEVRTAIQGIALSKSKPLYLQRQSPNPQTPTCPHQCWIFLGGLVDAFHELYRRLPLLASGSRGDLESRVHV